MAEVAEKQEQADVQGATGKVTRVIGVVVDVEFPAGQLPELMDAVVVT
jgi:F-type H+-transporting ATPase subunit beta